MQSLEQAKQVALRDKVHFTSNFQDTLNNFSDNINFLINQQKKVEGLVTSINNNSQESAQAFEKLNSKTEETLHNFDRMEKAIDSILKKRQNAKVDLGPYVEEEEKVNEADNYTSNTSHYSALKLITQGSPRLRMDTEFNLI